MAPIFRCNRSWIDVERFHRIDRLQDALDLGPATDAQQDVAAGTDKGQCLEGFRRNGGAQDVDARNNGSEVVGGPADEGENAAGKEADDPPPAVEDLFLDEIAEANPMFDFLLDPS